MTPTALIQRMTADGLHVAVTPEREIKVSGAQAAVSRWLHELQTRKREIICALTEPPPDVQDFIDDVEERAAIMQHNAPDRYGSRAEAWEAAYLDTKKKWLKSMEGNRI